MSKKNFTSMKAFHLVGGAIACFLSLSAWAGSPTTPQPPVPPGEYHANCDKASSGCYASFDPYVQWDDLQNKWLLTANCSGPVVCSTSSLAFGPNNEEPCHSQEISSCNDGTLSCGACGSSNTEALNVKQTQKATPEGGQQ